MPVSAHNENMPSVASPVIEVQSPNVRYTNDAIEAEINYATTEVHREGNVLRVTPKNTPVTFRTDKTVPKLGVMLVGWGGNNGTTLTATVVANKHNICWNTKEGKKAPNYYGSITQASTVSLGYDQDAKEVFVPLSSMLPMAHPNDLAIDGWDISSLNLADAMERARVLDYDLQRQVRPYLSEMRPRAAIYDKDFIAANQEARADNVIKGTRWEQVQKVREDIRDFKATTGVDKVIVLWTANTERFCTVEKGLNTTADELMASIKENKAEISPSTLFAVASILEKCTYINGSPQNTFVPGCLELAEREGVFIGGDDFKSGQTKFKSVLVDFLVNAGMKPVSIVSYNHLGNNDGKNLSAPQQFRSKEISKSNVVDDMVESNKILYKDNEKPDHCIVIKYVPYVGDSKRAMDEYTSEIMMGGHNTIAVHNTCEDSLLASPIILDLVILAELSDRITFKIGDSGHFQGFHSVLSVLSYLCKAPLVPSGAPLVNALFKQRACIENLLRACLGLSPIHHIGLEHKLSDPSAWKSGLKLKNGLGVKNSNLKGKNGLGHADKSLVDTTDFAGEAGNGVEAH